MRIVSWKSSRRKENTCRRGSGGIFYPYKIYNLGDTEQKPA